MGQKIIILIISCISVVTSQGDFYYGNLQYPNYQDYQIPQNQDNMDNMYNIPVIGQDDLGDLSPKLPYQEGPGVENDLQQPSNQYPSDQNGINQYQGYPPQQYQDPSLANQNIQIPQIGLDDVGNWKYENPYEQNQVGNQNPQYQYPLNQNQYPLSQNQYPQFDSAQYQQNNGVGDNFYVDPVNQYPSNKFIYNQGPYQQDFMQAQGDPWNPQLPILDQGIYYDQNQFQNQPADQLNYSPCSQSPAKVLYNPVQQPLCVKCPPQPDCYDSYCNPPPECYYCQPQNPWYDGASSCDDPCYPLTDCNNYYPPPPPPQYETTTPIYITIPTTTTPPTTHSQIKCKLDLVFSLSSEGDNIYYYLSDPNPNLSWYRADSLATNLNKSKNHQVEEGYDNWRLAEINKTSQVDSIMELLRDKGCDPGQFQIWLGGNKIVTDFWVWTTGEPVYLMGNSWEPVNGKGDCMMLVYGHWIPSKCSGIDAKSKNIIFLAQSTLIKEKEALETTSTRKKETTQKITTEEIEEITTEAIEPQTPT